MAKLIKPQEKRILSADIARWDGKKVILAGWIQRIRKLGAIYFISLRDRAGVAQAVADNPKVVKALDGILGESVVKLEGTVKKDERAPHGAELRIENVEILSPVTSETPIVLSKKELDAHLETILDYRPLSLRHPKIRAIFKVQAAIVEAFGKFLRADGFTEIKSPKIVAAGAEGGADIFEIKYFDRKAYLTQSPQFYKQMLVGVFERVFEVGAVYRAEPHSTTRHLNEYVSMDIEMGFIENHETIMRLENRLLAFMMGELEERVEAEFKELGAQLPNVPAQIPQMTLREAQALLKKEYKIDAEGEPDLSPEHERLISQYATDKLNSEFIFITHYPSSKRPFYAMDDPKQSTLTNSFDLLFRGIEITTGGQRMHRYEDYVAKMKKRKMKIEDFGFFLNIFKYGMPPHGGFGLGLERLTQKLLNLKNVREASLFPRDMHRITP